MSGSLSNKELILDWSTTGDYAEFDPTTFAVAEDEDGTIIYVGTANTDPIFMFDPDDGSQDILYKGILPTYPDKLEWDGNQYLYMILGGDEWNVLRIDMGG